MDTNSLQHYRQHATLEASAAHFSILLMHGTSSRSEQVPVSKRCDDKTLLAAQVLILVVKVNISDRDHTGTIIIHIICCTVAPLETSLSFAKIRR
jgi:hypothetical protein